MQIANITDPRYLEDAPKEIENHRCHFCGESFDYELDLWQTTDGLQKACALCFDCDMDEGTGIFIELIKGA